MMDSERCTTSLTLSNGDYFPKGKEVANRVRAFVEDLTKEGLNEHYTPVDLEYIINREVGAALFEYRLYFKHNEGKW